MSITRTEFIALGEVVRKMADGRVAVTSFGVTLKADKGYTNWETLALPDVPENEWARVFVRKAREAAVSEIEWVGMIDKGSKS